MTEALEVKKPLLARIAKVAAEFFWYGSSIMLLVYIIGLVTVLFSDSGSKLIMVGFMPKPILMVLIAYLLRGLVRSAFAGRPFTFDNVRRLRLIGLCALIYGPLNMLGKWIQLSNAITHHNLQLNSVDLVARLGVDSAGTAIFLGLLIFVLAQVFDIGVRLQTDNDLTV